MELVTGGTGIVGAHVLLELASTGRSVRALLRPGSDSSIVTRVLEHYRPDAKLLLERIQWVPGDILDMPSLAQAMEGVTHVYHAAAMVSFDPRDARLMQKVNAEGTANVVNAALEAGVRRLCHVSSVATIGEGRQGGLRHEGLPWQADGNTSAYALSKYDAEMEVLRGLAEGLDAVLVNPCVVLGPGIPGRSSMTLVERLAKGTRFYPPGSNAVVDARDVSMAMVKLMEQEGDGERYILAGENVGYRELFGLLSKAFGKPEPTVPLPAWALQLAWRAERIRTSLLGGRAFVTRSTVHTALSQKSYDASKAQRAGITFRTAEQAVANVAAFVKVSTAY